MTNPPIDYADVQGTILRGYRVDLARHFILSITDVAGARCLIGLMVSGAADVPQITSAARWKVKPEYFVNIGFTCAGLAALGLTPAQLATFDAGFQRGATNPKTAQIVGDVGESDPTTWVGGLSDGAAVHVVLSAVYLRVAGANNSIVRDARVFLASPWSRRRLTMGPYSMDLRERVAAAIDEGEGSERQIAKRFRVSVSFVTRLLQRRRDAGTLAPKPHGGGPRPVLGFPEQVRLAMLIAEHPDATLNQLKEWGGFACTLTTLWRTLRRFRLTYKKKTLHAGERDTPEVQAKRRRYRAKVRRIEAKRLVFVDETGVNTAMTPTHAWARRGERAEGSVPSAWGSTTVIAALGLDGVRAPLIFPGATDTQAFQTYVDQVLVPELRPGDVVVFDNLKPHLSRHVAESIERAGATVLPLPPYSSDYDPIEELWSKFKGQLRRIAARTKDGLYKAVGETLDSVTIQDILGWFNHSGLYATHG